MANKENKKKVLVIGFDGATFDFIRPWAEEGKLPNFRAFMERGVGRVLESTVPPMTAAAWTSFLTGKNPGNHGVLDFQQFNPDNYTGRDSTLVNSSCLAGITILDFLSSLHLKVCAITIPITYPPWEINGTMVSGPPTPDNTKAYTYPPGLALGAMTLYKDMGVLDNEDCFKCIEYEAKKRTQILCDNLKSNTYDFLMLVLRAADAAHHRFWRLTDTDCPFYNVEQSKKYGNLILRSYQVLDQELGRIIKEAGRDMLTFIVSDHGGCREPRKLFHVHNWLEKNGFLIYNTSSHSKGTRQMLLQLYSGLRPYVLSTRPGRYLQMHYPGIRKKITTAKAKLEYINWPQTKAYCTSLFPPATGIIVNVKGRQPSGYVKFGREYEKIRADIIEKIKGLRDPDTKEKIVLEAHKREEIYSGDFLSKMPDIVLILNPDYAGSPVKSPSLISLVPKQRFKWHSGTHNLNGIFMSKGNIFKNGLFLPKANIIDVVPTILYSMGLPIPTDIDGKVMSDIFLSSYLNSNKISHKGRLGKPANERYVTSVKEEEGMKKRLRDLGYLD